MSERVRTESGFALRVGTIEEARRMIGTRGPVRHADVEVNAAMIQYFCAVAEDANPSYWSAEFAEREWGGLVSPPSMLQSWILPLPWRPEGARELSSLVFDVPLPGDKPINVSSEVEFFEPVRVGDRLSSRDELVSISEEKRTALGVGHFVETVMHFTNQHGTLVARCRNTLFRYRSEESPA